MRHRTIKGILHNFLGTYTSRYTDFDGYWLFGMLSDDFGDLQIDLLSPQFDPMATPPLSAAIALAGQKFREQIEKAGFDISSLQQARLDIKKLPGSRQGFVNGRMCAGYDLKFVASAVSSRGAMCESEISVFVAPHDSGVERRSTRAK